jgi:hypothetical protein
MSSLRLHNCPPDLRLVAISVPDAATTTTSSTAHAVACPVQSLYGNEFLAAGSGEAAYANANSTVASRPPVSHYDNVSAYGNVSAPVTAPANDALYLNISAASPSGQIPVDHAARRARARHQRSSSLSQDFSNPYQALCAKGPATEPLAEKETTAPAVPSTASPTQLPTTDTASPLPSGPAPPRPASARPSIASIQQLAASKTSMGSVGEVIRAYSQMSGCSQYKPYPCPAASAESQYCDPHAIEESDGEGDALPPPQVPCTPRPQLATCPGSCSGAILVGVFKKKPGSIGRWQERLFVLNGSSIEYLESHGSIDIVPDSRVTVSGKQVTIANPGRVWELVAATDAQAQLWGTPLLLLSC